MRRELNTLDSTCIIFGIIVGAGIYETAPIVAAQFSSSIWVLGVWLLGGLLSLAGALCYAELATAYPQNGGDYVYLTRAYGDLTGWLFAWSRILIIRPGSIASMAFPFATYLKTLWSPFSETALEGYTLIIFASGAVLVMTAANCVRVRTSKWAHNTLAAAKLAGLGLILAVPLLGAGVSLPDTVLVEVSSGGLGLALILVLFTYGGWNEIAYIAAEVKDPQRSLLRALVYGTLFVTAIYLLVNIAFLSVLGHGGVVASRAVATDTVAHVLPDSAAALVSTLICISTLGAINGLILTGSRISYAFGCEQQLFNRLAKLSSSGIPVVALWSQAVLSLAIIWLAGSFQSVLIYTTAVVWLFFFLTGLAVIVLRKKEPAVHRSYKVFAYPYTVIIFCASAIFLTYSAGVYDIQGTIISIALALMGVPVYYLSRRQR